VNDLAISVLQSGDECRVVIIGELDLTTGPILRERLADARGNVVIDCSGLTFADSTGIAEFTQLAQRVASVTLSRPSEMLRRSLEILGLTDMLAE
jgi:anti-anti-sigma factor